MTNTQKPKQKLTFCYKVAVFIAGILFKTIMPVTYHGRENIPSEAPFILISNHNSMFDPLIVGYPMYKYHVRFLGKKELEKSFIMRALFKGLRMIPVDRHNMDMTAMRACLKVLKDGQVLGIFPEGTRHTKGVMEQLESGTAMIALRSKATLIPAYVQNKARVFRKLNVYYGEAIALDDLTQGVIDKDALDEAQRRITQAYRKMCDEHPFLGAK